MALYQSLRSAHRIEAGASTRGFNRLLHGGRSLNHYAAAHKRMVTLSPTHPLTNNPDEVGLTWICLDLPSVPMRDLHLSSFPPFHLSTFPPLHLSTSPPLHPSTSPPLHLSTSPPEPPAPFCALCALLRPFLLRSHQVGLAWNNPDRGNDARLPFRPLNSNSASCLRAFLDLLGLGTVQARPNPGPDPPKTLRMVGFGRISPDLPILHRLDSPAVLIHSCFPTLLITSVPLPPIPVIRHTMPTSMQPP